ncbi:unnamed protein product [Cyprideis torosa]|uniref:Uncharacterized protein n=1 Tax=Cyprideis torosa TaxID=163714 RepID=A0A7R8WPL4_9CRUS|nr:unnamed protein product [Cyprideis torosa]CAG0901434.1 unnamed protein product [Cyprideis torosa]
MKSEVYALAEALGVVNSIQEAAPTDGLWQDNRTDEDQLGASYDELEWAMNNYASSDLEDFEGREKEVFAIYDRLHKANRHKMVPIPYREFTKVEIVEEEATGDIVVEIIDDEPEDKQPEEDVPLEEDLDKEPEIVDEPEVREDSEEDEVGEECTDTEDDDLDGVPNCVDQCFTREGAKVNAEGCEIVITPEDKDDLSLICLGTMTWGEQNTEQEAHEQLDFAVDAGINFIDTAELYAIPIKAETQGRTETYIGNWLQHQNRDELFIASKAAGPGPAVKHIRNMPNFSKEHLREALEGSLRRLQTEYIDLYQLHWPERKTNYFGALGYQHHSDDAVTDFKMVLETLKEFIDEGKIRHIGISNETPWGTMQYLKLSDEFNLPRIASIQNPYSLLNRVYEIGLSEIGMRENVGLLAYSPLAGGYLTGATSIPQLKENIESYQIELDKEVLKKIEEIHLQYPNPAP